MSLTLEDLRDQILEAIEACEAEGIDPANVAVRGVIQPSWPIRKAVSNVGFVRDENETTPWLALACDGEDDYTGEHAFHADLNIPEPVTECEQCGWELTSDGCVNPECTNS